MMKETPLELANELLSQARVANQNREAVAARNEAWVRGMQDSALLGMHPFLAEMARELMDGRDDSIVYNVTRPLVKTKVSNLIPVEPNLVAVPSAPGETPRARADRSLDLIRAWQQSPDVWPLEERLRCEHYVVTVGGAWVSTVWDPMAGPIDSQGNPQGDVMVRWCPLQEVFPSPGARSSRTVRWLIERRMVSRREAEFLYPQDAHGVSTEGRFTRGDDDEGAQTDASQNDGRRQGGEGADEMVPIYWLWMRPYRGFPFGRLIVWNGQSLLLSAGPIPYADSSGIVWPWILRLSDNIVPQGLYADGIDDLIEPQRELNNTITKRSQWMESSMNPALLNPQSGGVRQEDYRPRPGHVINVSGTMMPRFMDVPEIPGSLFGVENAAMETMQMVSGMSDAMRGQGVDAASGRAVAYSAHLSKRTLKVAESLYMSSFASIMQNLLRLARIYYPEDRMIRSFGPGGRVEVFAFKRQDYDMMAEVWIPQYESVPMDRGSLMQEMMELQGVDAFNPENPGGAAILEALNYRTVGADALRAQTVHRTLARNEHVRFEQDPFDPVPVEPFHDHEEHLLEHARYMNTVDFAGRIQQDPQFRERLLAHVGEHEMAMVEQQQAGAAMPGAAPGGGGQKGAVGAPPMDGGNDIGMESPEDVDPLPEGPEVEEDMEAVATGETR
jgi:hypothetical protein